MKKPTFKRRSQDNKIPTRITNETVAEHRERILAGGRRFKYPMQYARHRLVVNAILIGVVTVVLLALVGWWQLYFVQNTSSFFYRVTRIFPVAVAQVDDQNVRYSNYLMYYNSSAHYLKQSEQLDLKSEDGKRQVAYIKRKSLDNAIGDSYARKLANERGISVTKARVDKVIDDDRTTANGRISQETYDTSALSVLGWTPSEYRQAARNKLLRQDVAYAIDTVAKKKADEAEKLIKSTKKPDFDTIAKKLGGTGSAKVTAGVSGLVPLTNRDGGLAEAASKLKKGQISKIITPTTGDGYYAVRLLERNDTQLSYAYLRIPLTEFEAQLKRVKSSDKITEYISVPDVQAPQKQ